MLGKIFAILFSTVLLSSCANFKIKNSRPHTVAGRMSAGAYWADTLDGGEGEMNLAEFIKFLEPDPEKNRGAAVCLSSRDWVNQKTLIEQMCAVLKDRCKYDIKNKIISTVDSLRQKSMDKSKELKSANTNEE